MKILSIDRQKGFTLVEVIATIVIAGVIGAMTFSFFGKSFVESPKTVSRLNKALGLQAVMENITQDYTRNYASNLSGLKNKVGTENTTYSNSYGSYKLIYNRYIKFNSTGGTESSMMPGTDLLKVTIQQVDTGEKLTAIFATGGASGSGGCCGGGGGGGGCMGVSVSINPKTVTSAKGATQQFTATVSGTTNTSVTWNATGGTIDANGLYTAPTSDGTYYVTATSVADITKSATATVNVGVSVSINPQIATIATGATQQFTATVSGTTNTSVTWSATGGTVDSNGLYIAPTTAGIYSVTVTSVADPTKSATSTVTVTTGVKVSVSTAYSRLRPNCTTQITTTVTGTTNTSVAWSATGGTLGSTSSNPTTFTAPASTGSYSVTATSVADPTASATTTIMVCTGGMCVCP